ncbi:MULTISPECIES: AAA family ATPase [Bacillus]|uniref:AAA family ATPase n=1 Tax=Bacillus TaxID=1386 RepID=UPI00031C37C2|nr:MULTISPECIES: AAA family ATPase [Bacillus]
MSNKLNQPYIKSIYVNIEESVQSNEYPFSLPAVKNLTQLQFHPNVTFLIGENGSGKSTILEAIATSYGFNPEGGTRNFNFSSFSSHSTLHDYIRVVKGAERPLDGFFFRAESFYNVATNIEELNREVPGLLNSYGGTSLHAQSHGESFMSIFLHRFRGNSMYILDEPEAALSPSRQLTFIARLHELVEQGCQFIIATHSPILMAYPNSIVYEIKDDYQEVNARDTDHYQITKAFLDSPERMLQILMNDK